MTISSLLIYQQLKELTETNYTQYKDFISYYEYKEADNSSKFKFGKLLTSLGFKNTPEAKYFKNGVKKASEDEIRYKYAKAEIEKYDYFYKNYKNNLYVTEAIVIEYCDKKKLRFLNSEDYTESISETVIQNLLQLQKQITKNKDTSLDIKYHFVDSNHFYRGIQVSSPKTLNKAFSKVEKENSYGYIKDFEFDDTVPTSIRIIISSVTNERDAEYSGRPLVKGNSIFLPVCYNLSPGYLIVNS